MNYYRQCGLEKGTQRTTRWVVEHAAKVGRVLADGFKVVTVSKTRLTEKEVKNDDYKDHRKGSDI